MAIWALRPGVGGRIQGPEPCKQEEVSAILGIEAGCCRTDSRGEAMQTGGTQCRSQHRSQMLTDGFKRRSNADRGNSMCQSQH